jgi:hypothetical protein
VWEVEGTDQFAEWYDTLTEDERAGIESRVDVLAERGPALGRPTVDSIKGSRHRNMKELRSGSIRVLFIFDPHSTAILLLGGNKRGDWTGWYTVSIPLADDLYDVYLKERKEEHGKKME